MSSQDVTRPDVMDSITESELKELELRFDDGDQKEFISLAETYGWSQDTAHQVWNFFVGGKEQTHPHDEG